MVKRTWFYPEIRVVLGRERWNVNSLEQAARVLMSDAWPLHDRTCEHAAEMLIKALQGGATIEEARHAFEAAARAAGKAIAGVCHELIGGHGRLQCEPRSVQSKITCRFVAPRRAAGSFRNIREEQSFFAFTFTMED